MSNERAGDRELLAEAVEDFVRGAGKRGRELPQIVANWEGAYDLGTVQEVLRGLRSAGRVAFREGRWVAVKGSRLQVGVVEALSGGDALIRLEDDTLAEPFFVSRKGLRGAVDGDRVLFEQARQSKGKGRRMPAAVVKEVVRRRHATLVGRVAHDQRGRPILEPYDPRLDIEVELTVGADELADGVWVTVATAAGAPSATRLTATVEEVLGQVDEPGVDVAVVLRQFGIPEEFPEAVLAETAGFAADPTPADIEGRLDLRGEVTVTIDGESARDFDDAISVRRDQGRFQLGVHIADVSHFVQPGTALDQEAYRRGTSVYYPERAIPMLPPQLSDGLCSLRPGVDRLTVSAFLDVDRDGQIVGRRFARSVIRSVRRLTYEEVRRLLVEERAEDAADYGEVLPMLQEARRLMEALKGARERRGSLDFDLPEGDVILDTDGYVVGIKPSERNVAHRIIEELMIAANEAVAAELVGHDRAALFRVHDPPDRARLEELRATLRPLGIGLEGDLENLHPGALQAVLHQVEGRPEEPFVDALVLRSQQRAVYAESCDGHYALGSRTYLHFTSPIRRYPDLVVHRRIVALAGEGEGGDAVEGAADRQRLAFMAAHTSAMERRAEQSERELLQWKKVRYLKRHVGERFSGRITSVQRFGLFVQLDGFFVDGLVPISSLGDDFYIYEPESHRLVGSKDGKKFQLAEPVEVELVGVSERHRGLDLVIAGMPIPKRRGGRRDGQPATPQRTRRGRRPDGRRR